MDHPTAGDTMPALLAPGERIDGFRVERLIGTGGMGEVYLARDTTLGRRVALKLLHPDALGSPEAVERFLREARTTARFSHPHIVTLYGVGEHDGRPYLALEFLEGQTLRERYGERRPSLPEALRVAHAVGEALAEAHTHQVLHRDLKPENVMIGRDGRVRVLDFGLAKHLELDGRPTRAAGGAAGGDPQRPADPGGPIDPSAPTEPGVGGDPQPASFADEEAETFETRGAVGGTPAYMAPEQWTGAACTPATDVWALGLLLYELLAGEPALRATSRVQLAFLVSSDQPMPALPVPVPGELSSLVARCLAKDPAARPPVDEVLQTLDAMRSLRRSLSPKRRPPFRGLRALDERDAARFFGRDEELAAFLERVHVDPVLPVIGASGAGKSSFVLAGVIPRLQEQERWLALRMRPGRHPIRALASLLRAQGGGGSADRVTAPMSATATSSLDTSELDGPSEPDADLLQAADALAAELTEHPKRLALALLELAERRRTRVLLFVDQLEEIHTLGVAAAERIPFLDALCRAADDADGPVRVVFTARDDHLGRLAEVPSAREVLGRSTVLRAPESAALETILVQSVAAVGYRFEDDELPREMVAEVRGERTALPLLQFAGLLLWNRRDEGGRLLRRADYEAMGGVVGALAHHADGILEQLSPGQLAAARVLLLRLVTPDATRATLRRSELLDGLGLDAAEVLDRLIEGRLVAVRRALDRRVRQGGAEGAELELVHDSLVRSWERLARWFDDSRDERRFLADVQPAAERWQRRGQHPDELWRGDALAEGLRGLERCRGEVPEVIGAFFDASRERERQGQRTRRWMIGSLIGVLALVALAMSALTFEARRQRQAAEEQRIEAERATARAQQRRAAVEREGARAALARGDLVEARAKLRSSLETADSPLARALWWQLRRSPVRWVHELGAMAWGVAFTPDGGSVVVAAQDGQLHVVDTATGLATPRRVFEDQVYGVEASADGAWLAAHGQRPEIALVPTDGGPIRRLAGHGMPALGVRFTPDGRRLVSTSARARTVIMWDVATGEARWTSSVDGEEIGVDVSPDGARVATSDDQGVVRIRDAVSGEVVREWPASERSIRGLRYTADGRLVTAGVDGFVRLWTPSGALVRTFGDGSLQWLTVDAHAGVGRVVASGHSGEVRVWDLGDGRLVRSIDDHEGAVWSVRLSPDGRSVASASRDLSARLWGLDALDEALPEALPSRGHRAGTTGVTFSADGRQLISGSVDRTVRFWDVSSGRPSRAPWLHDNEVNQLALSPDGARLATTSTDGGLRLWDMASGAELSLAREGRTVPWAIGWDPRGRWLATSYWHGEVVVRDADTLAPRVRMNADPARTSYTWGLEVSPDGRLLASCGDTGTVSLWSPALGRRLRALPAPDARLWDLAFSPDGGRLAAAGDDGVLRVWSVFSGAELLAAEVGARIQGVAWSPRDPGLVALNAVDGHVWLWPVDGGEPQALRGHRVEGNAAVFSPDGRHLATTGEDGTLRLWDVERRAPAWYGTALLPDAGEVRTHAGWLPIGAAAPDEPAPVAADDAAGWRRALSHDVRVAWAAPSGPLLCAIGHDDTLALWDRTADRALADATLADDAQVMATPHGCLVLDGEGWLSLLGIDGALHPIREHVTAMTGDAAGLLVAAGGEALALDVGGAVLQRWPAGEGVRAIVRGDGWIAAALDTGGLALWPTDDPPARPLAEGFEAVPTAAITALVAGPADTLLAGFADGEIGVWSAVAGERLHALQLHGAVSHLHATGDRVLAATELGDHVAFDVGVYRRDYCEVLRAVWEDVGVDWGSGRPQRSPPPADHRCAP